MRIWGSSSTLLWNLSTNDENLNDLTREFKTKHFAGVDSKPRFKVKALYELNPTFLIKTKKQEKLLSIGLVSICFRPSRGICLTCYVIIRSSKATPLVFMRLERMNTQLPVIIPGSTSVQERMMPYIRLFIRV